VGRALQAGGRVEDLEIGRADLEDVFVSIMQGRGGRVSPDSPDSPPLPGLSEVAA
jgi:hypothetical protein